MIANSMTSPLPLAEKALSKGTGFGSTGSGADFGEWTHHIRYRNRTTSRRDPEIPLRMRQIRS